MSRHRSRCWNCGYDCTDATATSWDDQIKPTDGDLSLCIKCGEWGVFDRGSENGVRPPNWEEFQFIAFDREPRRARAAWVEMDRKRTKERKNEPRN